MRPEKNRVPPARWGRLCCGWGVSRLTGLFAGPRVQPRRERSTLETAEPGKRSMMAPVSKRGQRRPIESDPLTTERRVTTRVRSRPRRIVPRTHSAGAVCFLASPFCSATRCGFEPLPPALLEPASPPTANNALPRMAAHGRVFQRHRRSWRETCDRMFHWEQEARRATMSGRHASGPTKTVGITSP